MKIAIIGGGISGLSAAYLLNQQHDVTVFEKADRIGGHTATIDFELDGSEYAIDTGFIVYNDWTYPNFIKLLDRLGVQRQATSMGFSVHCEESGLEYAGHNLNTLFAQRKNVLSPKFWRLIRNILRFNKDALSDLENNLIDENISLGDYLKLNGYADEFSRLYLIPMGAAIWSMSCEKMKSFPLKFFVTFFKNHGLLSVKNRPTWRVISGGSKQYIGPLTESFKDRIVLNSDIASVKRLECFADIAEASVDDIQNSVAIRFNDGRTEFFDQVVFACHSDEALALLVDCSRDERDVLGSIDYENNRVTLHWDDSVLPKNKRTWSSWNYCLGLDSSVPPTLSYNMNILQGLSDDKTFCVTLNDVERIDKNKVIGEYVYAHPQFSLAGEVAKSSWRKINGGNTWFCGAYWRNGFHEDGVYSAVRVANAFGISL